MKLAMNLPLLISWQAFGEAFALCRDLGIEPQRLLSVFTDISRRPTRSKVRAPMVAAMMADGDPGATTFTLDSACKDLRTMAAEGGEPWHRTAAYRKGNGMLRGGEPQRSGV